MVFDDGHNTQLPEFRGPSNSIFELDFGSATVWPCPPKELISTLLKFLHGLRRALQPHLVIFLLPERPQTLWSHHLSFLQRSLRFVRGPIYSGSAARRGGGKATSISGAEHRAGIAALVVKHMVRLRTCASCVC